MNTLDDLLLALAGAPSLPGAKCRGKHHLFDGGTLGENVELLHARWDQALGLCQRCPSLDRCGEWLDGLPKRQRPTGVVAGRISCANPAGRAPEDGDPTPRGNPTGGLGPPDPVHVRFFLPEREISPDTGERGAG